MSLSLWSFVLNVRQSDGSLSSISLWRNFWINFLMHINLRRWFAYSINSTLVKDICIFIHKQIRIYINEFDTQSFRSSFPTQLGPLSHKEKLMLLDVHALLNFCSEHPRTPTFIHLIAALVSKYSMIKTYFKY